MLVYYVVLGAVSIAALFLLPKFFPMNLTALLGAVVVGLLVPLPVYSISTAIAKSDQETFHEYWNGYETAATSDIVACYRDGRCHNTYSCDPYTVMETETYTDSEGHTKTRSVPKTKYHDCPYSKQETSYYVESTLGAYTIASNLMTGEQFRWGHSIPGGQVTKAPKLWSDAKKRIDAGAPGPVAKVNNYKNFILASQNSLLKKYSDEIKLYNSKGMLPAPAAGVVDNYHANKAYFVKTGLSDKTKNALTTDVAYLNGAVGTSLQGDLHVVFVESSKVDNPTSYTNALTAYWQSKEFGRDALAKNALVVVFGVNSKTNDIAWTKSTTGMPFGNEALITQLESGFNEAKIDKSLIGRPTYDVKAAKVVHSDGKLEDALFGANKFVRVSMSGSDPSDKGSGFKYLSDEWEPDGGTMVVIYVVSSILFLGALAFGTYFSYNLRTERKPDPVAVLFSKN